MLATALVGMFAGVFAGCAIVVPDARAPLPTTPRWEAPLPHGGDATRIGDWWRRLESPVLASLIDDAQRDNPTLTVAVARIDQARAFARAAGAAFLPAVDGGAQLTRSVTLVPPAAPATLAGVTLDARWELDLFGANRRTRQAALARVDGRQADWHWSRITLAADVAGAWVNLRQCEALLAVYREDMISQGTVLELTMRKVRAGFAAPADAALITASAAEASNRVRGQRAQCELLIKTLVFLTGQPEGGLRERLAPQRANLPEPAALRVSEVPAQALTRRPDLASLERELVAAALEVGVAQADRYPRISFAGSIGLGSLRVFGETNSGATWSIGPGLSLPLFDGGRRAAQVDRTMSRFTELKAGYRLQAMGAIREVEQALVRIDAAADRLADAERAAASFGIYLRAARARYENGTGSLFEQEDARRSTLNAAAGLLQLRAERLAAWITLYKALGGDWEPQASTVDEGKEDD